MDRFLLSLGEAFVHGVEVDWSPAFGNAHPDPDADLPTYPFQRKALLARVPRRPVRWSGDDNRGRMPLPTT
ncbi:hypothetical protein GCM10018952_19460 [Streptosporangium vulgare]